jgi:isopenicillin-N epimerase
MRSKFLLSSEITFLNNGSFGACPTEVIENYQYWQRKLEEEPVQFITKTGLVALKESKQAFSKFVNCNPDNFFFTANPTTAINTIVKSLELKAGDEILTTNLEYGAIDRTWNFYCKKTGAKYLQQEISLPLVSKEQFLEEFWKGLSSKTKIISISHITSTTALILPVKEIIAKAKALGLTTIIDGAHVPGHIDLDLEKLDPDFYTGAIHKWFLAPKGCSFLYVKKKFQKAIDPLIVSWGYESDTPGHSQFLDYHEYNGTRDFSAFLPIPSIIKFREQNNWEALTKISKQMILDWYPKFCELLNTTPICPVSSEFLGQMCSIPIQTNNWLDLKETLYKKYKIEIPVMQHGSESFIRISVQPYTSEEELTYLYQTLKSLKEEAKHIL